ncbi:hypothetical protein TruAng_005623 [Truncatella angustata]|nr:hypothetical protein TruAng_005623 [Truncatella angustata]
MHLILGVMRKLRIPLAVPRDLSEAMRANLSMLWNSENPPKRRRASKKYRAVYAQRIIHILSDFRSYHHVYVDESGCDNRAGVRRAGWAPEGATPVQTIPFHRDRRQQILPVYAQDGIVYAKVFQGSTDSIVFENFILSAVSADSEDRGVKADDLFTNRSIMLGGCPRKVTTKDYHEVYQIG